eukprot:3005963-Amphidinium_carterae.1
MSKFRMVAERVHRLRAEQPGQVHQQEQLGRVPSNYPVYSALLVKPTRLDPTSVSITTWSTSTRCRSDINMLTIPKQQPHRRELPTVFEGNKQDQQHSSMTTFKTWATEVQIHMSLEDHNLATVMVHWRMSRRKQYPFTTQATLVMNYLPTTVDPRGATTITAEEEAKVKDQKGNHPTTTFHHNYHTKENVQDNQKEKEKRQTLCVTIVEDQDTR